MDFNTVESCFHRPACSTDEIAFDVSNFRDGQGARLTGLDRAGLMVFIVGVRVGVSCQLGARRDRRFTVGLQAGV
ncbi:hypothetical protein D9M73_294930 [compost metagenome]